MDLRLQLLNIKALIIESLKQILQRALVRLVTGIIAIRLILHEVLTIFIYCVIGEVHVQVLEVAVTRLFILSGG